MIVLHAPERDAPHNTIDRDERDRERLQHIDRLVANLMDALIVDLYPMERPRALWHPEDLLEVLIAHRRLIAYEQQRSVWERA